MTLRCPFNIPEEEDRVRPSYAADVGSCIRADRQYFYCYTKLLTFQAMSVSETHMEGKIGEA